MFSVGMFLENAGKVVDVLWGGPAFKAGLAPGMKLVSIDGQPYSTQVLRAANRPGAEEREAPAHRRRKMMAIVELYTVHYDGGLKYPHLVRMPGKTDYLEQILAPRPLGNRR